MAGGRQARRASAETIPGSPRKRALPVPGDDVEYRACQRREHARRARVSPPLSLEDWRENSSAGSLGGWGTAVLTSRNS